MPQGSLNLLLSELQRGIDKVDSRLDSMSSTLERNTVSLEHHIRRTDELEKYVKHVENRVWPLEISHERTIGALKLFSVVSTVCGGIFAALKLLRLI